MAPGSPRVLAPGPYSIQSSVLKWFFSVSSMSRPAVREAAYSSVNWLLSQRVYLARLCAKPFTLCSHVPWFSWDVLGC